MKSVFIFVLFIIGIISCKDIVGSDPNYSYRYEGETFTCDDNKKSIPISWVNDNYCDCLDGTDEPGTAACKSGKFYCRNEKFHPTLIPSQWVNDGICDCCDGSDEYLLNNCEDTCLVELRKEYDSLLKEIDSYKTALDIKRSWIERAKDLRSKQKNIEALKQELEEINEKHRNVVDKISQINMKYEYISDDASLHDKINFHISKLFFKLRESISFIIPTELSKLKDELSELESKRFSINDTLKKINMISDNINYGPDDVYLEIIDRVYKFADGRKDYILMPFSKVDYSSRTIGSWGEWKGKDEMYYEGPHIIFCKDKDKPSSCTVKLVCNETDQIISFERSDDSCHHILTLSLPAACDEEELIKLEKKAKDYPFN